MSTIRWVDLLSSESNFSHSVTNNDDIGEKEKKKKFLYNKEKDLNNSFLNSYTLDLDNSNVGINLKIKNMCIAEKDGKPSENAKNGKNLIVGTEKELVVESDLNGRMNNNESEKNTPMEYPNGGETLVGKWELNQREEQGSFDDAKVHSQVNFQTEIQKNVVIHEGANKNISGTNKNSTSRINENCSQPNDENSVLHQTPGGFINTKMSSPEVCSPSELFEVKTKVQEKDQKETVLHIPNVDSNGIEEKDKSYLLNTSKCKEENNTFQTENAEKKNEKGKMTKMKIPSNSSNSVSGKRGKKIRNVSLDKQSIKNSYFTKYIVKRGNENKSAVETVMGCSLTNKDQKETHEREKHGQNRDQKQDQKERQKQGQKQDQKQGQKQGPKQDQKQDQTQMGKKDVQKGKKRKDRLSVTCENSTASKFNCTVSHEVTVDENNIPMNPTKKMKNKMKGGVKLMMKEGGGDKGINKNAEEEGEYEKRKLAPLCHENKDSETKIKLINNSTKDEPKMRKDEKNNLGIVENMPLPQFLTPMQNYQLMNNDNIDLEKFKNFDNNFINYLGDIRNNFSDPFVNSNNNRVNSRLKEIAVGKSTKEYKNYVKLVKYEERMDDDPSTPNAYENVTNAKFQAKYNLWRKKLHKFDTIS
ncbi:hypothetical protein, conserved [Plasmodium gonderi]|uniref:Histone RNA hairpin-binding protein RNA-binding domain-containing protein n=1 Tax=Plasmodium gonderi TaxID=77519 RepID=A0A1Y1JCT7_PLAGO|nr:hypothetical protein, conserved [Plasmodium gonderi]GAW80339.1 hypothetical protein, conserved [Plasmodium gonderi]